MSAWSASKNHCQRAAKSPDWPQRRLHPRVAGLRIRELAAGSAGTIRRGYNLRLSGTYMPGKENTAMKYRITLPIIFLMLAALACDANVTLPTVSTAGPEVTEQISVPAPTSGQRSA